MVNRHALHREQVTFGHHAHYGAVARHRHMPNRVARHQQRCILGRVLHGEREYGRGHDLRNRRFQRQPCQHHAVEHVVAGQDAQRRAFGVQHQHGADLALVHGGQGLRQRRLGCHADRRLECEIAKPRFQRLLGQGLRRHARLHGLARQLQLGAYAALHEFGEGRADAAEFAHLGQRQSQAVDSVVRVVGAVHRSTRHHGADGKQIAGFIFDAAFVVGARLARHVTFAHQQQMGGHPGRWRQDGRARAVVHGLRLVDEVLQVLALHLREWRVLHQLRDQWVGGAGVGGDWRSRGRGHAGGS